MQPGAEIPLLDVFVLPYRPFLPILADEFQS
jgi:hypothetical protein